MIEEIVIVEREMQVGKARYYPINDMAYMALEFANSERPKRRARVLTQRQIEVLREMGFSVIIQEQKG